MASVGVLMNKEDIQQNADSQHTLHDNVECVKDSLFSQVESTLVLAVFEWMEIQWVGPASCWCSSESCILVGKLVCSHCRAGLPPATYFQTNQTLLLS